MCVLASNTKIHDSDMLDRECCWKKNITIRLVDFSQEPKGDPGDPAYLNKGQIQAFFTINITLYATKNPRTKWIKFKLTDAVGMKSELASWAMTATGLGVSLTTKQRFVYFLAKRMMIAQIPSSLTAGVVNALNHTLPTLNQSTHLQLVGGSREV